MGSHPGFRVSFRFRLVGVVSLLVITSGNLASLALDSLAEHRHVLGGWAWVCFFDLHGWSTSDMNVQVRTCDGLLAPYRPVLCQNLMQGW